MVGMLRGGAAARMTAIAMAIFVACVAAPGARAEGEARISKLSSQLASSSSAKERLGAATALGRLSDRRALKPLVTALTDPSPMVRAVAAAALGKLGHKAALPALTEATGDADATVAKRAREAAAAIRKSNGLAEPVVAAASAPAVGQAGFGTQARALPARPDLYVVIKTASDDSPGLHDKRARQQHGVILRESMQRALGATRTVTAQATEARRYDLELRNLDVSVVKMEQRTTGAMVEVEVQLRLAISDHTGRMMSFLSGGAMVQVPRRSFNASYLPQLRRDALTNAVGGIFDKLIAHLRRGAGS
jgi:hypothetical protein